MGIYNAQVMSEYARKAAQIRQEGGLAALVSRTLRRAGALTIHAGSVTFFSKDLPGVLPAADNCEPAADNCELGHLGPQRAAMASGHRQLIKVRQATRGDLAWLMEGADPLQRIEHLSERFQKGDLCFVAVAPDGKAAHVRWVTTTRAFIPELGLDIVLNPGEAYFYNGYTRPEFRGQGIDGLVRCFIFRTLKDSGYSTAWSYVRGDNPTGMRAASRWQSSRGTLRYLRLLGRSPIVTGLQRPDLPGLASPPRARELDAEREERTRAWRAWFDGWLQQPLSRRSTGYAAMPEEYFASAADYINATLELDPQADVVLDVGCDSAMVSRLVAPQCRRFFGVDFVPGMLKDGRGLGAKSANGEPARFAAADGRRLPFAANRFSKVYCSAVIHTLPSHENGLAVIDELIRVCAPRGHVLVASVPDVRKRFRARMEGWKKASLPRKAVLPLWLLIPERLRKRIKRVIGWTAGDAMTFVEYDLQAIRRTLESRGLACRVLDFPSSYWSTDFRLTRSNLLIYKSG